MIVFVDNHVVVGVILSVTFSSGGLNGSEWVSLMTALKYWLVIVWGNQALHFLKGRESVGFWPNLARITRLLARSEVRPIFWEVGTVRDLNSTPARYLLGKFVKERRAFAWGQRLDLSSIACSPVYGPSLVHFVSEIYLVLILREHLVLESDWRAALGCDPCDLVKVALALSTCNTQASFFTHQIGTLPRR